MIDNLRLIVDYMTRTQKEKVTHEMMILIHNNAYTAYKNSQGRAKDYRSPLMLGIKIQPEQFHAENYILGNDEVTLFRVEQIKEILKKLEITYVRIKAKTGKEPPAHLIKTTMKAGYAEKQNRKTFFDFLPQFVEGMQLEGKTADNYNMGLQAALKRYLKIKCGTEVLYLDEITAEMVYRFEIFMHTSRAPSGRLYAPGTALEYIKRFKAVIRHAHKLGDITTDIFSGYDSYVSKNTSGRSEPLNMMREGVSWKISPEDLHKIETVTPVGYAVRGDLETATGNQYNYDLVRVRLIFLLQTWTGFAYADLCEMRDVKSSMIIDLTGKEAIMYHRQKTKELALIPVMPQTRALLEALGYNATPQCSYDTFKRKIKALLRYYIIDDSEAGTHLGRHVFGTRMLRMNFSMESVSRMMGHASISQTEKVYARIDLTKINADYDRILESLNKPENSIAI